MGAFSNKAFTEEFFLATRNWIWKWTEARRAMVQLLRAQTVYDYAMRQYRMISTIPPHGLLRR